VSEEDKKKSIELKCYFREIGHLQAPVAILSKISVFSLHFVL
jgi:hypothetical protein